MPSRTPNVARHFISALLLAVTLVACGAPAAAPAPTALPSDPTAVPAASDDLSGIKTYLVSKTSDLKAATADLKTISDRYRE